jgi:DNA recombination protein RmuC
MSLLITVALIVLSLVNIIILFVILSKQANKASISDLEEINDNLKGQIDSFGTLVLTTIRESFHNQDDKSERFEKHILGLISEKNSNLVNQINDKNKLLEEKITQTYNVTQDSLGNIENRLGTYSKESTEKLETIRLNVEGKLASIQADNNKKLDEIRTVVEDKLQKTLDMKMGEFYKLSSESAKAQDKRLEDVYKVTQDSLGNIEKRLSSYSKESSEKLEAIRLSVETKLGNIQTDNNKKLDEMRNIVDEKLQKTLNARMTESFKIVNDRLEQVHKGLGEMQTLAKGVGDLKKVMSNVKTRGILGEIQLDAILKEILAKEQYDVNVVTKKGSNDPVEFAIKIPNEDGSIVYLPIDSKFPADTYNNLYEAYEDGNKDEIKRCMKLLVTRLKAEAKDIRDKYLDPPNTTDFAILFLPVEGLYAEVINQGMVEVLQRDYHVNIAGPSTMAALLNSLQMGFRTFAIEQRSAEVWRVLEAVKTEFDKFADALEKTQRKFKQANTELDNLVGTRTNVMNRKLKSVSNIDSKEAERILGFDKMKEEIEEKETADGISNS